jgi:hypothetical protein
MFSARVNKIRNVGSITLVVVLLLTVMSVKPASAEIVESVAWIYMSPSENCTYLRSQAGSDRDFPGGIFKSWVHSYYASWLPTNTLPCSNFRYVEPNWLRVKLEVNKWTGTEWIICLRSDWMFNANRVMTLIGQYVLSTPHCGVGWYNTLALGDVLYNNAWYGGTPVVSPSHYVSGAASTTLSDKQTIDSAPQYPPWVNPDGSVNVDAMPDCFHVGNADGSLQTDSNGQLRCILSDAQTRAFDDAPPSQINTSKLTNETHTVDENGTEYVQAQPVRP